MKQFFKEIVYNHSFLILLFITAITWQIFQITHSPNSKVLVEVFIGIALLGFLRNFSVKSIYFYIFLSLSILMFILLSFSSILFNPNTKIVFEYLIIIVLLAFLKDNIVKSKYIYIIIFFSVLTVIFQYLNGVINIPWIIMIAFIITKKIKSYPKIVDEVSMNEDVSDEKNNTLN